MFMPGGWWLPDVRVLLFTKGFGVSEEQARTARKMGEHSTSTVRESHGNRTSTVRRVIGDWKIAASHLRTMILALKHVVQDFLRLFGLSTGLFCTHERNKCRCGRVTAEGGGVTWIPTATAPVCGLATATAPVCGLGGGALLMAIDNPREGTSALVELQDTLLQLVPNTKSKIPATRNA
jgi:hypothetical protein